jgi:hypothetical protein
MRSTRPSCTIAVLAALSVLGLAGCSSTTSTDDVLASRDDRPARSGTYPDFSAPLDSAMPQMSDQEAADQQAQLSVLARQRQAGTISAAEYQRRVEALRLLGQQARQ